VRALAIAAIALALALPASCGAGDGRSTLTVSAAASLKQAFERYARDFDGARVRLSFGGSDELAAQIRQGARPDVYAAANTELPRRLWREGSVERPVLFAANRLVLAVPRGSRSVRSFADLERPGVKLVIGAASVPVGAYARRLLHALGRARADRVLANVRSNEPDVGGIVGKLAQGAADAGFLYETDVNAAGGRLREIPLPRRIEPRVSYAAAVVRSTGSEAAARRFVAGLSRGAGREALDAAGFERPAP
jgi:molybdate transport system substrate-binding protein